MKIKNKITEKHIIAVLLTLTVGASALAVTGYAQNAKYRKKIEISYQKSFTELVDYVGNINVYLNKFLVAGTKDMLSELSERIWSETALAKSALGQLPISETPMEKTSNFITQLGDYIRSVTVKLKSDETLTETERKNISDLAKYSDSLNKSLKNMEDNLMAGNMELSSKSAETVFSHSAPQNINESFQSLEESFENYPSLIYDGPFSEHIVNKSPTILKESEVSLEKALENAENFCEKSLKHLSDTSGKIPSYIFANEENTVCVEVSKNGGHIVMATDCESISNPKISKDTAAGYAEKFLKKHGFENFRQTGFITEENTVNFSFANTLDEYTVYPELVKIKISLSDGKVCGFEANGYLHNKAAREYPTPIFSKSDVKKKLPDGVDVEKINLACIPKTNGKEVWCYEVKAKCNGKIFLIYFNTQTMAEEDILMLVEDGFENLTV